MTIVLKKKLHYNNLLNPLVSLEFTINFCPFIKSKMRLLLYLHKKH